MNTIAVIREAVNAATTGNANLYNINRISPPINIEGKNTIKVVMVAVVIAKPI